MLHAAVTYTLDNDLTRTHEVAFKNLSRGCY
jgi:hypothetical protein